MTATECLRELLDERKAFWIAIDGQEDGLKSTCWKSGEDQEGYCYYNEDAFGVVALVVSQLTPEQAIAATLGAGTCHEVEDEDTGFIVCSECGAVHDENYTSYYCWCCGKKVVDE